MGVNPASMLLALATVTTNEDVRGVSRILLILPLLTLLVAGLPDVPAALADEQPKVEKECLSYDSAYENAPLFVVKVSPGEQRAWLYKQTQLCPKDKLCGSRQKAFLVSGDMVFAGPPNRGFRCAYYGRPNGKIVAGFIPVENLGPVTEDTSMSIDFVIGTWNYESDSIGIKAAAAGRVSGDGQASYQTAETVNEGSFSAQAPLAAGQKELVFKEGDDESSCVVKLHRRGPYLVASDNGNCGGLNVSFGGIYTKAKTK
jgi:hypothetical protein